VGVGSLMGFCFLGEKWNERVVGMDVLVSLELLFSIILVDSSGSIVSSSFGDQKKMLFLVDSVWIIRYLFLSQWNANQPLNTFLHIALFLNQ